VKETTKRPLFGENQGEGGYTIKGDKNGKDDDVSVVNIDPGG